VHQAVMVHEVVENLALKPGGTVLDATLGGGGHAYEMLKGILPGGRLIGMDQDISAIEFAKRALKGYEGSAIFINANFRELDKELEKAGVERLSGALFDLGISSYQLEDPERGFGISKDSPLDMRMDKHKKLSAARVINGLSEKELADVIFKFGEERYARRIARGIAEERKGHEISTTKELVDIVMRSLRGKYFSHRIHPATRTFQAIRIYVNDELGALEEGLKKAIEHLEPGARVCVISFHSLEDRIVKNTFKDYAQKNILKIITKKPLTPSADEIISNPRSRSAKLRTAERIRDL